MSRAEKIGWAVPEELLDVTRWDGHADGLARGVGEAEGNLGIGIEVFEELPGLISVFHPPTVDQDSSWGIGGDVQALDLTWREELLEFPMTGDFLQEPLRGRRGSGGVRRCDGQAADQREEG